MKTLAIETPVRAKIRNIFLLYGFPLETIDYIIELKKSLEDQETMYFQRNCIIHECLHFNLPDKTIQEYQCEKKLYNDYYRLAIPMNRSIQWCLDVGDRKGDSLIRNRCLTLIEMVFVVGFIMTSTRGRLFPSSLEDKLKLFSKKPYGFFKDTHYEFIQFQNPIIIDASGELLYY